MAHSQPVRLLLMGLALAALLVPTTVLASGGREREPAEETVRLSLLVLSASPDSAATRLPMDIAPYLWNQFRLTGNKVETSSDTRYREVGGKDIRQQRIGEMGLSRIDLRIAWRRTEGKEPATVRVSFELEALLGADGAVAMQPGQYALVEGIRQSGKTSGQARVSSIATSGARGFVAEVLVR